MAKLLCLVCKESCDISRDLTCVDWVLTHISHKLIFENDDSLDWFNRWKEETNTVSLREVG